MRNAKPGQQTNFGKKKETKRKHGKLKRRTSQHLTMPITAINVNGSNPPTKR